MAFNATAPYELAKKSVAGLPQKMRDVVTRRFGLKSGKKETLESIGKEYGITRERVRQIEENALAVLRKPENIAQFSDVFEFVKKHINEHGQLRRESTLLGELTSVCYPSSDGGRPNYNVKYCPSALLLIMEIGSDFSRQGDTRHFYPSWMTDKKAAQNAILIIEDLRKFLENKKNPVLEEEILDFSSRKFSLPGKIVLSYMGASKIIEQNIFGEWGLVYWPHITPRGMRDKAYLVFRREKKPLHFTVVSELINDYNFSPRRAYPQTVHNELIKDDRFVLIGRGTYALAEWGYPAGTVGEVIETILKEAAHSMNREEIVEEVLKKRMVKPNTIVLNLQNKERFVKTDDGKYTIRS